MATSAEVLNMLIPNGGWTITENSFDSIVYDDGVKPISEADFKAGFAVYDTWKAEQDSKSAADKAALLAKLGITADEAKLLLS
jgi:hypothetical protein